MSSFAVQMPSVGTHGEPIAVGTSGTLLHTSAAGTTTSDEVWVWVANVHATNAADVSLSTGGVTFMTTSIPAKSQGYLLCAGLRINNGGTMNAQASAVSSIVALVNVNRITL